LATDPTVGDKTPGTMVAATGALAGVDVTIDKFRGAGWEAIEGKIPASLLPAFWADKAAGAVYAAAKDVIDTLLALVTASNFGNGDADKYSCPPADFGQDDSALVWEKATGKIKRQRKVFMMGTSYAANLFGSSNLALIYASAGDNFLKSGQLPQFLDLNQMHYGDFPENSENLGGAVIGQAALACALVRPGFFLSSGEGNVVDRRIITEPDSGISVMYTVTAEGGGKLNGEVAIMYGVAKGQNSVVRVVKS
jgi:hypothetical protein